MAGEPLVQGIYHLKASDPLGLWEGGNGMGGKERRRWRAEDACMRVPIALFSRAFLSNYDGPANFGKNVPNDFCEFWFCESNRMIPVV